MTNALKVILEYDDLHCHPEVDCLDFAESMIRKWPNIIINFFTTPNYKDRPIYSDTEWCDRLIGHINNGNICLGLHGYTHAPLEFKHLSYEQAYHTVVKAEQKMIVGLLPFVKVWRSPQWGINAQVFQALCDLNYTHVYSHTDYRGLNDYYGDKTNVVYYNWNLKDEYPIFENPVKNNVIVIHGHTHNVCGNGIEESYGRLKSFIQNNEVEFARVNEYR